MRLYHLYYLEVIFNKDRQTVEARSSNSTEGGTGNGRASKSPPPNKNLFKESLPALEALHNMLRLADNHVSNSRLAAS